MSSSSAEPRVAGEGEVQGDYRGPDRRGTTDRRTGSGNYRGTERRAGTDRRVASDRPGVLRAGEHDDLDIRPARLDRQLSGAGADVEQADALLDRLYADPFLAEVVSHAAAIAREQARAEGYAMGWADGRQAATTASQAELARSRQAAAQAAEAFAARAGSALAALAAAGRSHRDATAADLAEVGDALAEGALEIAAAAIGRELRAVDAEVAEAVRTAVRTLGSGEVAVIHVNPRDLVILGELPAGALPDGLRLEPDPEVPPGGALAVSANRQVLAHLPAALARAREVLRG